MGTEPPRSGIHPVTEPERLRILRSFDVLHKAGDTALAQIAELAAELCETPMAALTLVDDQRERTVAAYGLKAFETARDGSFGGVVVRTGQPLVVPDVDQDDRFRGARPAGEAAVRFYAGVPLISSEGAVLGILCVMSPEPGVLAEKRQRHLQTLAGCAVTGIELRRQQARMEQMEAERVRVEGELQRRADHLDEAQRIAQVGSWELLVGEDRIVATPECYRIFGLQPETFEGTFAAFLECVHPDDRAGFLESHAAAMRGEAPLEFQYRVVRPDGEIRFVLDRGQLHGTPGEPGMRLAGTVRDITGEKQAERERQQLLERESAARQRAENAEVAFRVAFENLLVGFVISNSEGRLLSSNSRFREMLDYTEEEIRQLSIEVITEPEDWPPNFELFRRLVAGEIDHFVVNKRYLHRNGQRIPCQVYISALPNEAGQRGTIAIVLDVRQEVEALEKLRGSQWLMNVAGHAAHLGGWAYEVATDTLILSDEVWALFEAPSGRTMSVEDTLVYTVPEDRDRLRRRFQACRTGGVPYDEEIEIVTAKGRRLWVRALGQAERNQDGRVVRVLGALQDISEARSANLAAARLADTLQTTLESITDAFFTLDLEWRFTFLNQEAERLLNRAREDLIGQNVWKEFPEAVGAAFDIEYHRAMRDHVRVSFEEYYPPLETWFQVNAYPSAEGLAVYFQDVTERHRAQAQLEAAWMRSRRLIETSFDAVALLDEEGRFVEVNSQCEQIWGYTPGELLAIAAADLVAGEKREAVRAAWERTRHGQPGATLQTQSIRKDGRMIWVQWSCVWSKPDQLYFMVARDVTDQVAAEERTRQSQRLEAIGQLTGGVAHDFNNLLTVVLGSAELLTEKLSDQAPLARLAEMIRRAAMRGADLTRGLLAFARRQALEPVTLEVAPLIERLYMLVRRTVSESIEIQTHCSPGVWPVMADPAQLESALLNLCLNARDAMPDGGHLHIEADNVVLDESYARQNPDVSAGAYVVMAVSDDGSGMTPEVLAHAFDPFFTTKDREKGTGLGLSMVYGFAKQTGGHARIYSEPGHGTTVKLYVPRSLEAPAMAEEPPAMVQRQGTRHILVVEDDDLVRAFAAEQITSLGYHVTAARNGAEALEIVRSGVRVDLLFTDVVMTGGMNGPQLAQAILELIPGLPVLYTSGYTENAIIHQGRVDPGIQLLHKPYSRQALAERLDNLLREPGQSSPE